jgi:Zn ribbon nucleic-acid-binding protein
MADKVKVWFDAEADFLDVCFNEETGYLKETAHDAVMERVNAAGQVIGFTVQNVSSFKKSKPLEALLLPA